MGNCSCRRSVTATAGEKICDNDNTESPSNALKSVNDELRPRIDVSAPRIGTSPFARSQPQEKASTPWERVQAWIGSTASGGSSALRGDASVSVSLDSSDAHTAMEDEHDSGATSRNSFACLPLSLQSGSKSHHSQRIASSQLTKVPYGQSVLHAISPGDQPMPFTYHGADPTRFQLRSSTYLKNRVKAPSAESIYRLVAADLYTTHKKHWHIARRIQLPAVPHTKKMPDGSTLDDANIPPLLVMHVMTPKYSATFIPTHDGPNFSFIYYFALPEGFDPATFHTPAALRLLQRLAEPHSDPAANLAIRQHVKMIAQVVNTKDWAASGKISRTEMRLIDAYNGKPVLMRPAQRFYRGKNYLEIDFDLHRLSYFSRKSMEGYISRLQPVIWEHGWCLEGRKADELPEVLLAGMRACHWDFTLDRELMFPNPALLAHMDSEDPAAPLCANSKQCSAALSGAAVAAHKKNTLCASDEHDVWGEEGTQARSIRPSREWDEASFATARSCQQ